jgi:hypothetical protein
MNSCCFPVADTYDAAAGAGAAAAPGAAAADTAATGGAEDDDAVTSLLHTGHVLFVASHVETHSATTARRIQSIGLGCVPRKYMREESKSESERSRATSYAPK